MAANQEEVDQIKESIRGIHEQLVTLNQRVGTHVDHSRVGEMQEDIDGQTNSIASLTTIVNEYKDKMDNINEIIDIENNTKIENHEKKLDVIRFDIENITGNIFKEMGKIEKDVTQVKSRVGTAIMARTSEQMDEPQKEMDEPGGRGC